MTLSTYSLVAREGKIRIFTNDEDDYNKAISQSEEKKEELFPKERSNDNNEEDNDDDSEYDYLLDDPDILGGECGEELKLLEEKRRTEIEYEMLRLEITMQHGYGVLRQIHPGRILRAAGLVPGTRDPPYAVVIHLLDPDSIASASLDLHIETIAPKLGRGTKFMRSGGRTVLSFEADLVAKVLPRLNMDSDIPALIAVREGVVINVARGLRELTGSSSSSSGRGDEDVEVVPDVVTAWLDRCGVLIQQYPDMDEVCRIRPEEEALMEYMMNKKPPAGPAAFEEFYNCGVKGCNKVFFHEHVGTKTDEQSGLIVPENEVIATENNN